MSWKRWLAAGVFATGLGVGSQAARAEDPAPKKDDAAATPAEAPKKKDPFFGNHFAMYLETRGGSASFKTVFNPLNSGAQSRSQSQLDFSGSKIGQFTVGWTLPRGRGQYLLAYNGIADGDFKLNATGLQTDYEVVPNQVHPVIAFALPWWRVTVSGGQLTATKTPPVWNPNLDDANFNGKPDPDEIRFPATTFDESTTVPKGLGNRIQTWDLFYRREFGGLKIRSRWTAGVRYLSYQGALATPSWLTSGDPQPGFGYSDGVQNALIVMQQSTTGLGPAGSGEIQFNFFRQRLSLYGVFQAAFLMEKLRTDSGPFTYLAGNQATQSFFPGVGRIQDNVSKSSWNISAEVGLRVKLLEGFHLIADWNRTGYLDTMLLPYSISIPATSAQIPLGTTALFVSRDFQVSSVNLGLSFQF